MLVHALVLQSMKSTRMPAGRDTIFNVKKSLVSKEGMKYIPGSFYAKND